MLAPHAGRLSGPVASCGPAQQVGPTIAPRKTAESMSVRGSYCAPNANGKEAGVAQFRGPMSRNRMTPTAGVEGRNMHRCSGQCGTPCKKVSTIDRDNEDASSKGEPCPGQDTSWIGAYE
jgi:hypothetical protein